eukprot:1628059-Pyramimonas_sp.AAC.1
MPKPPPWHSDSKAARQAADIYIVSFWQSTRVSIRNSANSVRVVVPVLVCFCAASGRSLRAAATQTRKSTDTMESSSLLPSITPVLPSSSTFCPLPHCGWAG